MSPYSDIQRGFTGESNALPLTSLQTIATQRVRWFARLAILFFKRAASRQTWPLLSFGLTPPECLTRIKDRKFNQKTACHYPLSFQGV
ncbi:hypothetical protein, partial [Acetobacter sp.]|uniref:hypothetical protein n=1 Tax=Acetobacter sp. TaxID=440 RepID=UPI0039E7B5D0